MDALVNLKSSVDGFDIEYEVIPIVDPDTVESERQRRILQGISAADERLSELESKIAELNADIDRLTNQADGFDYAIAVTSGVITGLIDAFIVGEWNFANAKKEANKEINNKVIEFAKKQRDYMEYCNYALEGKGGKRTFPKDPDRLDTAIGYLEWKFPLPGDGAYSSGNFGIDGSTHRLDDLCHHPTLVGLICCLIVQFTGETKYINKYGEEINIPITVNEYGNFVGNNAVTKMFSGVINWFMICSKTLANRKGHLMSDVATPAGIPGSFLSTITELASLPCFQNADFLQKLRKAFKNGFGTGKGQINLGIFNKLFEGAQNKLDSTTEKAVAHELKRQALPVVINEVLVRASYFIRRFIIELKEKKDVSLIDWRNVIPFNNRTIVRMMTIATGTFTATDLADAAIRSVPNSADMVSFFSNMVLRVNFVGVGRFSVAVCSDVGMGISRAVKRNTRIKLVEEELFLLNAKVYYSQTGMWITAESVGKTLEEAYGIMEKTAKVLLNSIEDNKKALSNIGEMVPEVEKKNPGLIDEIKDILFWG